MQSLAILIGAIFGFATNFWWLWLLLGFLFPPMFIVGIITAVLNLFTPDANTPKDVFDNIPIGRFDTHDNSSFKPKGWKD